MTRLSAIVGCLRLWTAKVVFSSRSMRASMADPEPPIARLAQQAAPRQPLRWRNLPTAVGDGLPQLLPGSPKHTLSTAVCKRLLTTRSRILSDRLPSRMCDNPRRSSHGAEQCPDLLQVSHPVPRSEASTGAPSVHYRRPFSPQATDQTIVRPCSLLDLQASSVRSTGVDRLIVEIPSTAALFDLVPDLGSPRVPKQFSALDWLAVPRFGELAGRVALPAAPSSLAMSSEWQRLTPQLKV